MTLDMMEGRTPLETVGQCAAKGRLRARVKARGVQGPTSSPRPAEVRSHRRQRALLCPGGGQKTPIRGAAGCPLYEEPVARGRSPLTIGPGSQTFPTR